MELAQSFWVWGIMPVQFLLVLGFTFFAFSIGQYFLKRIGKPLNAFGQAALILLTTYAILRYLVTPPLPSSLMYNYMGAAAIFTFLLISSTERSWNSFKGTVLDTITGKTQGYRIGRAAAVILLPLVMGFVTYQFVKPPDIEAPVELRGYHPRPPARITVYPPEYFMEKKS